MVIFDVEMFAAYAFLFVFLILKIAQSLLEKLIEQYLFILFWNNKGNQLNKWVEVRMLEAELFFQNLANKSLKDFVDFNWRFFFNFFKIFYPSFLIPDGSVINVKAIKL